MATNYIAIARDHVKKYGTEIEHLGEFVFAHLYADRTHFLFELLQNAEDALGQALRDNPAARRPRTIHFLLRRKQLEVSHYGRPFAPSDISAICAVGRSTKTKSLTDIGKFGIGFKSVYAFTRHPEVHSGIEHFVIDAFVKPRAVPDCDVSKGETRFVLPFDNPEMPAGKAFLELKGRFPTLGAKSLLFLRHTESIEWVIEGGGNGRYLRTREPLDNAGSIVRLTTERNGATTETESWLVYSQPISDSRAPDVNVAIAFALLEEEDESRRVATVEGGRVFVFFETERESHLGFLLHAPFQTTPSRESIPADSLWNQQLVTDICKLVETSLESLRQDGLLDHRVLETLPLEESHFGVGSLLGKLYAHTKSILYRKTLIPAHSGGHVGGTDAVLAGSASLRELFHDSDLKLLGQKPTSRWVAAGIAESTPLTWDYLKSVLGVPVVDADTVGGRFDKTIIENKSDDWIASFYLYLATVPSQWRPSGPLRNRRFIRLENGEHVAPFGGDERPNAYLPSDTESHFPTVRRTVCDHEGVPEFLRRLGLNAPNAVDEVLEIILSSYRESEGERPDTRTYTLDLGKIREACRTVSYGQRSKLLQEVGETPFLPAATSDGKLVKQLCAPAGIYWPSEDLRAYFGTNADAKFLDLSGLPEPDEWSALLFEFGVSSIPRRLRLAPHLTWQQQLALTGGETSTRSTTEMDYDLDGLEPFLQTLEKAGPEDALMLSQALWRLLTVKSREQSGEGAFSFFRGVYKWFYHREHAREFEARFTRHLRAASWLIDVTGARRTPPNVTRGDLAGGYSPDQALEAALMIQPSPLADLAKAAGLDPRSVALLREKQVSYETLKRLLEEPESLTAKTSGVELSTAKQGGKPRGGAAPQEDGSSEQTTDVRSGMRRGSNEYVLRAIVRRSSDGNPGTSDDKASRIGKAGIQSVVEYESKAGRRSTVMPPNHPGYDIKSTDAGGAVRYIEVKAMAGGWESGPVWLSATQYQHAMDAADASWLYVVENADTTPTIHPIRNPISRVDAFGFVHEWRELAESD